MPDGTLYSASANPVHIQPVIVYIASWYGQVMKEKESETRRSHAVKINI